jgi:integrase
MAVRRVKNHGKWVWRARVVYRGRRRVAYRATKDEARQLEGTFYHEVREEVAQADRAGERPATCRALLDLYVAELELHRKKPETVGRARQTVKTVERVLPDFLDRPVSAIGDADILAFVKAREQEGRVVTEMVAGEPRERRLPLKPGTINRDLVTLRAALKWVRPEFRFPNGAFAKSNDTRVRWLRPEEELLVFETMPQATRPTKRVNSRPLPFAAISRLAALTLMRLSEIRTLRREYIHLEQGVLMLPQTKTEPRPVILSTAAQRILHAQLEKHPDSEWVFPNPDGRPYSRVHVSRVFRKAARGAGLKDFHFHDLRHHGATMALNKGYTGPIVMALGGWRTEKMMRRYAAVTDQTLRAAAEAVSGFELSPSLTSGSRTAGGN